MKRFLMLTLVTMIVLASSVNVFATSANNPTHVTQSAIQRIGGGPSHFIVQTESDYATFSLQEMRAMADDLEYPSRTDWINSITTFLGACPNPYVSATSSVVSAIYSGEDGSNGGFKSNIPIALCKALAHTQSNNEYASFRYVFGMYETGTWTTYDGPFYAGTYR